MRVFPSEPLRMSNGPVFPCPNSCRNRAHNLNRELFKGRRSLEPVGSRTDTVERGNVGNLVGWSCIENPEEFMSRGS